MALLNYTTKIPAYKTATEIQLILSKHGARAVLTEYAADSEIESISFKAETPHGEVSFRLPIKPDAVLRILEKQAPRRLATRDQAIRVAWRNVKDWILAQMAMIETEMVRMEQVFLPYMLTESGQTFYERMLDCKLQLTEGQQDT